jgi:phosphoribosylformylglycinamidine synthase subunit PurQ / glutaminase
MPARIGVVVFPGTNCEHDTVLGLDRLGASAELVWHGDRGVQGFDALVVPGGFAHGDYLRPGAIARFSPVMAAVAEFAASGGPVLGICNGFQVLTEAGLLPGALQKNRGLRFLCTTVGVRVESSDSALTRDVGVGTELQLPINHFEGNYTCDAETLAMLRAEDRVVLRYVGNPNGSVDAIAAVCNESRTVVGLMPHPERATDPLTGSVDGLVLLGALLRSAGASPTGAGSKPAAEGSKPAASPRTAPATVAGGGRGPEVGPGA